VAGAGAGAGGALIGQYFLTVFKTGVSNTGTCSSSINNTRSKALGVRCSECSDSSIRE